MSKQVIQGVLGVSAIFILGLVTLIASLANEFEVSRGAVIDAPPSVVFEQVNNLQNWEAWSPWFDYEMETTYSGSAAGEGAVHSWVGNEDAGAGTMTIITSEPDELIEVQLEFIEPFESTSIVRFEFQRHERQTIVTWKMSGENSFFMKAVGLFYNMDDLIGKDFEQGLAQLETAATLAIAQAAANN